MRKGKHKKETIEKMNEEENKEKETESEIESEPNLEKMVEGMMHGRTLNAIFLQQNSKAVYLLRNRLIPFTNRLSCFSVLLSSSFGKIVFVSAFSSPLEMKEADSITVSDVNNFFFFWFFWFFFLVFFFFLKCKGWRRRYDESD